MTSDLDDYLNDLNQEAQLRASDEGAELSVPEAFTLNLIDVLVEAGEVDDAQVAMYEAPRRKGLRFHAERGRDDSLALHDRLPV